MSAPRADIGVIGGSGLYDMAELTDVQEVRMDTPFGDPSDAITLGKLGERRVAFLPRHGRGHRLNPTVVPYRANVFALKRLGVTCIVAVSAVGSLKEEIRPLDMVVPDQIIDRTGGRPSTFFDDGIVVHVGFAEPFCGELRGLLLEEVEAEGLAAHGGETYVCIEGPQFSTKAESELYRSWGAGVIGMTAVPEAKLAREAEVCYATLAAATDYDCWHPDHESVTAEMIISNVVRNTEHSRTIVRRLVGRVAAGWSCTCHSALQSAIVTAPDRIPARVKRDLAPLIGKYVGEGRD